MTTGADTIDQEYQLPPAGKPSSPSSWSRTRWCAGWTLASRSIPGPAASTASNTATTQSRGDYVTVQPPERVVFTFSFEGANPVPSGSTTVEITLTADGDGTILRLRHSGLPAGEAGAPFAQGWQHFLERLTIVAAGGDPGPDPWADEKI